MIIKISKEVAGFGSLEGQGVHNQKGVLRNGQEALGDNGRNNEDGKLNIQLPWIEETLEEVKLLNDLIHFS